MNAVENTSSRMRIQMTRVEKDLNHLKEDGRSEKGVRTGLVLRADAFDIKERSEMFEAALQVFAGFHEEFDVVERGKVEVKEREELGLVGRKRFTGDDFQEICEIVSRVEGDPVHVVL